MSDDMIQLVPTGTVKRRSTKRYLVLSSALVVIVGCGAVVLSLATDSNTDNGESYSLAYAATQINGAQRIGFVGTITPTSGGPGAIERMQLDAGKQLVQIDEIESDGQTTKSSTLADLSEKMVYAWHDNSPGSPAGWIGGHMGPKTALFYQSVLTYGPRVLTVVDRLHGQGMRDLGLVEIDGQQVTKYEVTLDTDLLAALPGLRESLDTMGAQFSGTMTYDFFVSKDSHLVEFIVEALVNDQSVSIQYTQITTGDDVAIDVPTDYQPLDSTGATIP